MIKKIRPYALIALTAFIIAGCDYGEQAPSTDSNPNDLYCKGLDTLGTVPVHVKRLDDQHCYPTGIFAKPTDPDKCDGVHYHYTLISLDGHERHDEGDPCGAAKQSEVEATGYYYVAPEVINNWNELWKKQGQEPIEIQSPDKEVLPEE